MEIQTSRFGALSITEEEVYTFTKGLPGFEEESSFIIVSPEEDEPFSFLQSTRTAELVFIIADPFLFYSEYEFELPESATSELEIEHVDHVIIRSIINMSGDLDAATINLVAPVIFHAEKRKAKQVVLGQTKYAAKHPLFSAAGTR
ncbi:flagellar assembly protein FliW [Paenibacillus sp. OV219]|uniref:flagellar assembly protein FliW n=1 Tax=Paenibacillus sp. OV219 TaxID=1884377 RepID=UPI0008B1BF37|nr:flagellar assembly protein FliW [Paenibacillus sp. OV219]SEN64739.1 flagellar assembly factor FliW [Paenibacillus sp. OV219]